MFKVIASYVLCTYVKVWLLNLYICMVQLMYKFTQKACVTLYSSRNFKVNSHVGLVLHEEYTALECY